MALRMVEPVEEAGHPTTRRLGQLLRELAEATTDAAAGVDDDAGEADLVDQIALAERLRSAVAALQDATTIRFAGVRTARETVAGHRPDSIGRGVAEEVALACHLSPTSAARRLGLARALWCDLPRTYAALAVGRVSERLAEAVAQETRHLD